MSELSAEMDEGEQPEQLHEKKLHREGDRSWKGTDAENIYPKERGLTSQDREAMRRAGKRGKG